MRPFLQLSCAALVLAGCGGRQARPDSSAAPAAALAPAAPTTPAAPPAPGAAPRAGVPRLAIMARPEIAVTPTPPEPPLREPTAHYASLEAARDAIEAMLRRSVPAGDTAIHFGRETVTFEHIWVRATERGLAVHVVVNDTTECPHEKLMDAMQTAGWVGDENYRADGDDGGSMGLVCRQFLCVVEAQWHGYDPMDTTYVPPPGCRMSATVVPRRADDTPDR